MCTKSDSLLVSIKYLEDGKHKKKNPTYYSAVSVFKESTKSSESISGNRVVRREMVQNELYRVVGRDENVS